MMMDELAQAVLQKKSLAECSVDELQEVAQKYPFSPAVQLLLARKMKDEKSEGWQQQLDEAALYVPNSSWLHYLMEDVTATGNEEKIATPARDEAAHEPVAAAEKKLEIAPVQLAGEMPVINAVENAERAFAEPDDQEEQEEMDAQEEETTSPVTIPGLKIEPIDPHTAELSFTPFHTVDYFASQGIKMREEEKPADKFGQQLRSFTEWLKALRDAPLSEAGKQVSTGSEQKVEQLAKHSLSEKEVVTEAMAEVWEKQGDVAKAVAIYEKLSLQNPAKSAYFAGLIKKLKST